MMIYVCNTRHDTVSYTSDVVSSEVPGHDGVDSYFGSMSTQNVPVVVAPCVCVRVRECETVLAKRIMNSTSGQFIRVLKEGATFHAETSVSLTVSFLVCPHTRARSHTHKYIYIYIYIYAVFTFMSAHQHIHTHQHTLDWQGSSLLNQPVQSKMQHSTNSRMSRQTI